MSLSFMDTFSALVPATYTQVYEKYIFAKRDIKAGGGGGSNGRSLRFYAFGASILINLDYASMGTFNVALLQLRNARYSIRIPGKRTSAKYTIAHRYSDTVLSIV